MPNFLRRAMAPLALAALVLAGCNKGDSNALNQDSALSRDLARVGQDSTAQPELKDVPAEAPAEQPAPSTPKATTPKPTPKPKAPATKAPAPTPTPTPVPTAQAPETTASGNTVSTAPKGTERPLGTIASGTTLALASTEKVCTNTNRVGDRFVATVSNDVTGANGAVIPAGSKVVIELTKLKRSENTNDQIEIGMRVVSIAVGNKVYTPDADIVSASVDRVRNSSKGNDAKKVLGGAVAGAILGQVIGKDRKGTIIGAAAGAAAGGAAAAATANYEGCVNSGAAINVRLTSTLTMAAAS